MNPLLPFVELPSFLDEPKYDPISHPLETSQSFAAFCRAMFRFDLLVESRKSGLTGQIRNRLSILSALGGVQFHNDHRP